MTDVSGEAQPESPETNPELNRVTLEPLRVGGQTWNWGDIEDALRASIHDDLTVARCLQAIRAGQMIAWAIWLQDSSDRRINAILVTSFGSDRLSGEAALIIYSATRNGDTPMTADDWKSVDNQLSNTCKTIGVRKIIAVTESDRIANIAKDAGWTVKHYCEKEVA